MKKIIAGLAAVMLAAVPLSCGKANRSSAELMTADQESAAADSVKFTEEDVQALSDFLLAKPSDADLTDKPYDLNGNGRWDVFDLCLMKQEAETAPTPQSDTIVVYFSRTGNTEKIAEHLISITGADSYVIRAAVPYTDEDIAYNDSGCRANQEQNDKTVRPEIAGTIASLESYDTVFLGYPIWWGEEPRIIDTFLESVDLSQKTVIPFCTSASSGISTSEKNIAALVPIGEQLAGKRFSASATKDDVQAWYDTLPLTKEESEMQFQIKIGSEILTAEPEDNSSAEALAELLKEGSMTLDLHDYGSFEKVGELPQALPRNDEQISVDYGDIILYQGNQFSIYYDKNSWSFTKLGHISGVTQEQLKAILGEGNVTVELSLK